MSSVGAEHLCDCRSHCFLRDDAACRNLGRPKKKGADLCGVTAPLTGSLVCGGEPVARKLSLPWEEHRTLGLCLEIGATLGVERNTRPPASGVTA